VSGKKGRDNQGIGSQFLVQGGGRGPTVSRWPELRPAPRSMLHHPFLKRPKKKLRGKGGEQAVPVDQHTTAALSNQESVTSRKGATALITSSQVSFNGCLRDWKLLGGGEGGNFEASYHSGGSALRLPANLSRANQAGVVQHRGEKFFRGSVWTLGKLPEGGRKSPRTVMTNLNAAPKTHLFLLLWAAESNKEEDLHRGGRLKGCPFRLLEKKITGRHRERMNIRGLKLPALS